MRNQGFRPNRQQMSILCALRLCYDPVNILTSCCSTFVRATFAFATSGATNRVGGGCHDNHKDHRNNDRRIRSPDHVRARRRHRPQGADRRRSSRAAAAVRPRLRRRSPERLQFPRHFADRPGPGRLGLCRAALQGASEYRALRRHLGLEHQAADHTRPPNSTSTAASARRSGRSPSISASCTTGIRARRSSSSPIRRDHADHDSDHRRHVHARRHRLLGSLRQGDLDGDRLAGDLALRLLRRRTT